MTGRTFYGRRQESGWSRQWRSLNWQRGWRCIKVSLCLRFNTCVSCVPCCSVVIVASSLPFGLLITRSHTRTHTPTLPSPPPHTLFTVSFSSLPAAAARCHHYLKSGWLDSRCKNCCRSKDRCGAWLRKNQPDALYRICASSSAPDMGKVGKLADAGIDMQYTVSGIGHREMEAPCRH